MNEREHLEGLCRTYKNTLSDLQQKAALHGSLNVPSSIKSEMRETEQALSKCEQQLLNLVIKEELERAFFAKKSFIKILVVGAKTDCAELVAHLKAYGAEVVFAVDIHDNPTVWQQTMQHIPYVLVIASQQSKALCETIIQDIEQAGHAKLEFLPYIAHQLSDSEQAALFAGINQTPALGQLKAELSPAMAAYSIVKRIVDTLLVRVDMRIPYVGLSVATFVEPASTMPALFYCDWEYFHFIQPIAEGYQQLKELLNEFKGLIRSVSSNVVIHPESCSLSASFVLGYTFSRTSPFKVFIDMPSSHHSAKDIWSMEMAAAADQAMFEFDPDYLESPSQDVSLEISITKDVTSQVDSWLKESTISLKRRLQFSLGRKLDTASIKDAGHATALVKQICDELTTLRSSLNGTIHVFMAAPTAFSILLGTQMNAFGRIQLYEFDKTDDIYYPSVKI